jgi:acetyl-CoA carboxylase biotin carboxyl carrier protein
MAQNPPLSPENSDGQQIDWSRQVEYVRGLAGIVSDLGLSELEVESDGIQVTLKAPSAVSPIYVSEAPAAPIAVPYAVQPQAAPTAVKPANKEDGLAPIVSPMVGVFYRQPSPNDPPFVEVGDRVEKGQTVGLVEAMKVFNEITAEFGGVVAEVKAQTGDLVETGAPLILVRR